MLNTFTLIAAALYFICACIPNQRQRLDSGLTALAWLAHGAALWLAAFAPNALRVGFADMLSIALWVSVFVYWSESQRLSLSGLKVLLLPVAGCMVLLPLFFPGNLITLSGKPAMFPWHIVVALSAWSTLTVAAFHALVMTFQDAHLHKKAGGSNKHWLSASVERLPALMTMERILFRLIWIGFVLLSLTVISGVIFSEEILGVALKWNHKSVFSLISWIVFGVLLIGREWQGWRGKTVLKLTLGGFVTLLLAYVGTQFVYEVILQRGAA